MKKKVFITGASGTVGKAFIKEYHNLYDIYSYSRNEKSQVALKREFPNVEIIIGSIEDIHTLDCAIANLDIDIIKTMILENFNHRDLSKEENDYIFTDKSLENLFYMRFIKEIFPNAKVVYCKRNAFSSIMSIIKNNLTKVSWAHSLENIFTYFDIFLNEIESLKKDFPNFIYEVEYEKFVKDPEIESKKLLEYCNLPWNKRCLEFYKRKELVSRTASKVQIRKAIYQNSIDKYSPYKEFLKNYANKYFWFNFN